MARKAARDFTCPQCGVPPLRYCLDQNPNGTSLVRWRSHQVRVELARQGAPVDLEDNDLCGGGA